MLERVHPSSVVRLVDREWGRELRDGRRGDTSELRVVCPFIKRPALIQLLGEDDPGTLRVVTRFNLADFGAGVSDISALRHVLELGGTVRGIRGLHAKVFIFGSTRSAVTSANLTGGGLRRNHEFGCVSEEEAFVSACRAYFDELWVSAGDNLTTEMLDKWEIVLQAFKDTGGRLYAASRLPDFGTVDDQGLPQSQAGFTTESQHTQSDGWYTESTNSFVKFFGRGNDRESGTRDVLEEIDTSGSHWSCTYRRRPWQVVDGDTMFITRLTKQDGVNGALIYGRAIGQKHKPGRDEATPAEIDRRAWRAEYGKYVRVHHAEFVAGTLGNGVQLNELMDELGADAFATTQANLVTGGNTNPRNAYLQQPAVRLSADGATWVTQRLEAAMTQHGRVPETDLRQLDWPTVAGV